MTEPNYKLNPNLVALHRAYCSGKAGAVLEGSSRSGKTWSSVDFLVWLCSAVHGDNNSNKVTINILKETYNSFKTTLYADFNRRLPDFGIPSPFAQKQEVHNFKLWGNTINLLGTDSESVLQGVGSDYFWINEAIDVTNSAFDQTEMRCRIFWWMDYNPKVSSHWIYNKVTSRPDVLFKVTTFLDNPGISRRERAKILSYEPTHPEDRNLPVKDRRPHPTNIANGTADDYMWNVYGLGLRSAPEGLVFQHVRWISEFPEAVDTVIYGMDFGYVNDPTVVVKFAYDKKNIWVECLYYAPTESPDAVMRAVEECGLPKSNEVYADNSEPGIISMMRQRGYRVFQGAKFPGSVAFGISLLKSRILNIVENKNCRREQENYKWRKTNGITHDTPVDAFNHFWDAARYCALAKLKRP